MPPVPGTKSGTEEKPRETQVGGGHLRRLPEGGGASAVLQEQDKFGRMNISEKRPWERENNIISRGRNEEDVPEVWDMSE